MRKQPLQKKFAESLLPDTFSTYFHRSCIIFFIVTPLANVLHPGQKTASNTCGQKVVLPYTFSIKVTNVLY